MRGNVTWIASNELEELGSPVQKKGRRTPTYDGGFVWLQV